MHEGQSGSSFYSLIHTPSASFNGRNDSLRRFFSHAIWLAMIWGLHGLGRHGKLAWIESDRMKSDGVSFFATSNTHPALLLLRGDFRSAVASLMRIQLVRGGLLCSSRRVSIYSIALFGGEGLLWFWFLFRARPCVVTTDRRTDGDRVS